jgi:hypothetical protein
MTTRRWIALVFGSLLALVGCGVTIAGSAIAVTYQFHRDAEGYFATTTEELRTSARAITSRSVDLRLDPGRGDVVPDDLGRIRLRVEAVDDAEVFVGIGPTDAVEAYLDDVSRAELTDVGFDPFTTEYRTIDGDAEPAEPSTQGFWVAAAAGSGRQQVLWDVADGDWTAVVMHADGSPGVAVRASAGITASWVLPLGLALLAGGLLALAAGAALVVAGASGSVPHGSSGRSTAVYPVHLEGHLDEPLGRWTWLVKWLLAIPHVLLLVPLWLSFVVLTGVALVSIVVTGRYPRRLFDFNVGVLRWTWRVGFYAFSALGTDRYPPFSLESDPTYPADLVVDHPERLSRGLALVKVWLLALPHYVVLALLTGGVGLHSGGALGLLVLVAGILLTVNGSYPAGLFDVVMGCNRWSFRVLAYVALLRDEYPPFRFDGGGSDPASSPPPVGPSTDPEGTTVVEPEAVPV